MRITKYFIISKLGANSDMEVTTQIIAPRIPQSAREVVILNHTLKIFRGSFTATLHKEFVDFAVNSKYCKSELLSNLKNIFKMISGYKSLF